MNWPASRPAVPVCLLLVLAAPAQLRAQQAAAMTLRGYRVGVSIGPVLTVSNPYQCGRFGVGMDLTIGRSLGAGWLASTGGRVAEHYAQGDSVLQTVHFAAVFAEVGKYEAQRDAERESHTQFFNGVRAGYLRVWGPGVGAGARGGGFEVTGLSRADIQASRSVGVQVAGSGMLQLIDGRWGVQFAIHVGLAVRFGSP